MLNGEKPPAGQGEAGAPDGSRLTDIKKPCAFARDPIGSSRTETRRSGGEINRESDVSRNATSAADGKNTPATAACSTNDLVKRTAASPRPFGNWSGWTKNRIPDRCRKFPSSFYTTLPVSNPFGEERPGRLRLCKGVPPTPRLQWTGGKHPSPYWLRLRLHPFRRRDIGF